MQLAVLCSECTKSCAEIADTQKTLAVLSDEIHNLIQHFKKHKQKIYTATIQIYNALVSDILKLKTMSFVN